MNKIIPKQNTSFQNNFWIIQVAAKGKCWSLCIQKKNIFLQYFFLMVVLMWEHVSFTNLKVNLLSYHDNRCYAILFVFLSISFCNFLRNYSYSIRYIISRLFWIQWSFCMLLLLCCSMFSEYINIYALWFSVFYEVVVLFDYPLAAFLSWQLMLWNFVFVIIQFVL